MHFNNLEKKTPLFVNDLNSFISQKKRRRGKVEKKLKLNKKQGR